MQGKSQQFGVLFRCPGQLGLELGAPLMRVVFIRSAGTLRQTFRTLERNPLPVSIMAASLCDTFILDIMPPTFEKSAYITHVAHCTYMRTICPHVTDVYHCGNDRRHYMCMPLTCSCCQDDRGHAAQSGLCSRSTWQHRRTTSASLSRSRMPSVLYVLDIYLDMYLDIFIGIYIGI